MPLRSSHLLFNWPTLHQQAGPAALAMPKLAQMLYHSPSAHRTNHHPTLQDGYDAFLEGRVVKDGELLPMLPSLMRNHLQLMRVADASEPLINSWRRESIALALQSGNVTKHAEKSSGDIDERRPSCGPNSILPEQVKIAPCVDGRICRIDAKNDNQAHYEVDALLAVVDL